MILPSPGQTPAPELIHVAALMREALRTRIMPYFGTLTAAQKVDAASDKAGMNDLFPATLSWQGRNPAFPRSGPFPAWRTLWAWRARNGLARNAAAE